MFMAGDHAISNALIDIRGSVAHLMRLTVFIISAVQAIILAVGLEHLTRKAIGMDEGDCCLDIET